MPTGSCKCCGLSEVEIDNTRGTSVCVSCGAVLEDSAIVSEMQFEENCHGTSTAVGQFLPADAKGANPFGYGSMFYSGYHRDSRDVTIAKAKSCMQLMAQQLRIESFLMEEGLNFYKIALSKNLTKGRRSYLVYAACLYTACRFEKSSHLLIDFCDLLQLDVFSLGRTCAFITKELSITLPYIDPCIYLLRYASQMNFDDKTHEVYTTALRLLKRMKRDSIHHGRVPAGVCGAALLMAARYHNFDRSCRDIVQIVRIHETTLKKRLKEFSDTPSSVLTMDEFLVSEDVGVEQDPPSFTAARIKDKERLQQLNDADYERSIRVLEKTIERQLEKARRSKKCKDDDSNQSDCESEVDMPDVFSFNNDEVKPSFKTDQDFNEEPDSDDKEVPANEENGDCKNLDEQQKKQLSRNMLKEFLSADIEDDITKDTLVESTIETIESYTESSNKTESKDMGIGPSFGSLGLKEFPVKNRGDELGNYNIGIEVTLDDVSDEDVDVYIINKKERKAKLMTWNNVYGPFLEEMRLKRIQAAVESSKVKRRKRKKPEGKEGEVSSASEAVAKVLKIKKVSSKINYDVLRSLNMENYSAIKQEHDNASMKQENENKPVPSTSKANVSDSDEDSEDNASEVVGKVEETKAEEDDYFEEDYESDESDKDPNGNVSVVELIRREMGVHMMNNEDNNNYDDDDY